MRTNILHPFLLDLSEKVCFKAIVDADKRPFFFFALQYSSIREKIGNRKFYLFLFKFFLLQRSKFLISLEQAALVSQIRPWSY